MSVHPPAGHPAGGPLRYDATVVLVVDPAGFGASMRVAVIDVPTRCPFTRTVVPTGKLDAEPGACNDPKAVLGVKVTVNETPPAVLTVHTPPLTAVTVPRTPGCLARPPRPRPPRLPVAWWWRAHSRASGMPGPALRTLTL